MHWCSRNLFSAYHTHHNKCTYTRACTPLLAVQSLLCHKNNLRILKSSTSNKEHWVEAWWRFSWTEHPHRVSWLNTPDASTRLLRSPYTSSPSNLLYLLTAPLPSGQKTIKIYDSSWRSRGCVVAQASSDHPRWTWYHWRHTHMTLLRFIACKKGRPTQKTPAM